MADNSLELKAEEAFKSIVDGLALSGVASLMGSDDSTISVPNVTCEVDETDEEIPLDSGNFVCVGRVTVNSSGFDASARATHKARAATVKDAFMSDGLAETLTAAVADFHVLAIYGRRPSKGRYDKGFFDALEIRFLACPSDL